MSRVRFIDAFLSKTPTERQNIFLQIQRYSDSFKCSVDEASRPENRGRNRYGNILAPDSTRIKLVQPSPTESGYISDYINANLILIPKSKGKCDAAYIVGQYPLECTQGDFWSMVIDQNIRLIVTLSRLKEGSRVQGNVYWPINNQPRLFKEGSVSVRVLEQSTDDIKIVRELLVNGSEKIHHIEFLQWPDFGICSVEHLVDVINTFNVIERSIKDTKSTNYIHCSAGVGRSGVFCVVDCVKKLLDASQEPIDNDLVVESLLMMRTQRPGLIQTYEQFELCYLTLQALTNVE